MKTYPRELKITVQVTERDIQRGKPRNCVLCPVNLAIRRTLRKEGITGLVPLVSAQDILLRRVSNSKRVYRTISPKRVVNFILKVDGRRIVKPTSFNLTFKATK